MTSFVRTLPDVHRALFERLAPEHASSVEFVGLHQWAVRLLRQRGVDITLGTNTAAHEVISQTWKEARVATMLADSALPEDYWWTEIETVIKGRGLTDVSDYLSLTQWGEDPHCVQSRDWQSGKCSRSTSTGSIFGHRQTYLTWSGHTRSIWGEWMSSSIAWLDTSADEQRRIREMIALFSQHESRDELGIGQIRDVFSDSLFPGASVIQTRARYFLIVPWVLTASARRGKSGAALVAHAAYTERRLVELLKDAGATDGLIGRRAGSAVKILPSTIYWSGLRTYGILTHDVAPDRLSTIGARRHDGADELAARVAGDWDPTLPEAPDGFPQTISGGLDLTAPEARWLSERILSAVQGTLLAHLLTAKTAPDPESAAPWHDSVVATAPAEIQGLLRHAELFSLAMNGAALLYNLQVGEHYESQGYTRIVDPVQKYRDDYDAWLDDVDASRSQLNAWDRNEFWQHVLQRNPRIAPRTRMFVTAWIAAVVDGSARTALGNESQRRLVSDREQAIKRSQSRLVNDRLLGAWSGESGNGRLVYRWPQVRRIITDIHNGVASDARA